MPEEKTQTMGGIGLCPSPAHRSILGLVRVAMGRSFDDTLLSDLNRSAPEDLVRIATYTYVHVILAAGLERTPELAAAVPRDLAIFFEEMQAANQRRNRQILTQLETIGSAFAAAGLHGVALKGSAELLDPLYPQPAFRFLSDVDILLPEDRLEYATETLRRIGAVSDAIDDINARDHHHTPPLLHPDWPVQVELHRALAQGAHGSILDPVEILERARASAVSGLSVPAPADRLAHAVLHAQFSPPRFRDKALSPRDIIDMDFLLTQLSRDDIEFAQGHFRDPEARAAWAALDAIRVLVLGDEVQIDALAPDARAWAAQALVSFGRPGRRRAATLMGWIGWYTKEAVVNPERRAHYARKMLRPGALRQALAHHRDRWRRTR